MPTTAVRTRLIAGPDHRTNQSFENPHSGTTGQVIAGVLSLRHWVRDYLTEEAGDGEILALEITVKPITRHNLHDVGLEGVTIVDVPLPSNGRHTQEPAAVSA